MRQGKSLVQSFLGLVAGCSYFIPDIFELLSAFYKPTESQRAYLWQIDVPHVFHGKSFGDYFNWAILRAAIPLAIYRTRVTDCGNLKEYNLCNPNPDTILLENDMLTVLGNKEFAEEMAQQGYLKGPSAQDESISTSDIPNVSQDIPERHDSERSCVACDTETTDLEEAEKLSRSPSRTPDKRATMETELGEFLPPPRELGKKLGDNLPPVAEDVEETIDL